MAEPGGALYPYTYGTPWPSGGRRRWPRPWSRWTASPSTCCSGAPAAQRRRPLRLRPLPRPAAAPPPRPPLGAAPVRSDRPLRSHPPPLPTCGGLPKATDRQACRAASAPPGVSGGLPKASDRYASPVPQQSSALHPSPVSQQSSAPPAFPTLAVAANAPRASPWSQSDLSIPASGSGFSGNLPVAGSLAGASSPAAAALPGGPLHKCAGGPSPPAGAAGKPHQTIWPASLPFDDEGALQGARSFRSAVEVAPAPPPADLRRSAYGDRPSGVQGGECASGC